MRPPRPSSTPSASASGLARTPAAHTTTPAGRLVPSVSSTRWSPCPSALTRSTPTPRRTTTPRRSSVRRARSLLAGPNMPSRRGAASTTVTRTDATSRSRKSFASTFVNSSIIAPAVSTPGRSTAAHDHVERSPGEHPVVDGRPLEALEHGMAQRHRVVEVLQRDRVLGDAGHAVGGRHRAGGDHQRVVGEGRGCRPGALDGDRAGVEVGGHDPAEVHGDVALSPEDAAHGVGDIVAVEPGRGHLVQQRLEQVVVVGVDQIDVRPGRRGAPWRRRGRRTRLPRSRRGARLPVCRRELRVASVTFATS